MDPSGLRIAPIVADADEATARWEIHPLAETAPLIRACLAASADESRHLIVVSDANGMLLWVEGNPSLRLRAADSMNFAEGTLWSEGGAGTNAIGTALAAEHAVQVFASEHFNEVVQEWTCAAAPVHDPDTGQVIGVIDLTGQMSTVHPHSMAVAIATGQAVEAHLRCEMLNRDARLLSRYGDRLASGPGPRALIAPSGRVIASQPLGWLPAAASRFRPAAARWSSAAARRWPRRWAARMPTCCEPRRRRRRAATAPRCSASPCWAATAEAKLSGRQIPLRPRHAEILTLLCASPDGLTSEELAEGVYGDSTRGGGIRVEISRLRKLLGDCIETEHYRLRAGVLSDVSPGVRARRTAARCARRRRATPDRCSRARGLPAWCTSARRWSAGCASR